MKIEEAKEFFAEFYRGEHHIHGKVKPFGPGWQVDHRGPLSTFDFDDLTRLVFLAHDKCVRVELNQSGPGMIKICIWQREGRTGSMFERHPTIEAALENWRTKHPI